MSCKIEKIISKTGEVVPYDPERIINSIARTIIDVEHATQWIAKMRAKNYFEAIDKTIYDEFYNIPSLLENLFRKYISFEPQERHRRLENSHLLHRLVVCLRMNLDKDAQIEEFVENEISHLLEKYRQGLFPPISEEERKDFVKFISEKAASVFTEELKDEDIYPTRDFIMDEIENVLKKIGEIEIAEGFMIFREGKRKIREGDIGEAQFTRNGVHYGIAEKTLAWNIANKCEKVFDLNDWVANRNGKNIKTLIELSDKRFIEDVRKVAEKILMNAHNIRMVIIAGPSSSNKTTTTIIISQILAKHGLKLKQLNVDDYFKDLSEQVKDEFGDYDFEMPDAIDMELLNHHFEELLSGKTVKKPKYNFKTGRREDFSDYSLAKDEILLIDCLHGLYRNLTASVPREKKFSIYIESMNILRDAGNAYTRWTDIRMLKRMIRDVKYRNYSTEQTLAHWPYVRKGELKHILPYIFSTDAVINSGLPYELPALKKSLENLFPSDDFIENLRKEGRLDPYIRGVRVKALLQTVEAIQDLSIIPPTSPLREFIGGSSFIIPHNE